MQKGRSSSTRGRLMYPRPSFGAKSRAPGVCDGYFGASRYHALPPFPARGSGMATGSGRVPGELPQDAGGCAGGDPKSGPAAGRSTARDRDIVRGIVLEYAACTLPPAPRRVLREGHAGRASLARQAHTCLLRFGAGAHAHTPAPRSDVAQLASAPDPPLSTPYAARSVCKPTPTPAHS